MTCFLSSKILYLQAPVFFNGGAEKRPDARLQKRWLISFLISKSPFDVALLLWHLIM